MKFILIHTEARKELEAAIAYYEEQKVGLGVDLLTEVEKVFGKIQQNPNVGTPHTITEVRRYTIQHFPYLVFYIELEEVIWVIAIAHGKRKPDYWKKRKIEMSSNAKPSASGAGMIGEVELLELELNPQLINLIAKSTVQQVKIAIAKYKTYRQATNPAGLFYRILSNEQK